MQPYRDIHVRGNIQVEAGTVPADTGGNASIRPAMRQSNWCPVRVVVVGQIPAIALAIESAGIVLAAHRIDDIFSALVSLNLPAYRASRTLQRGADQTTR